MKDIFYKFEFDEKNVLLEKRRLHQLLSQAKGQFSKINLLKRFPPCILDQETNSASNSDIIRADVNNLLITNNLYFGDEYKDINKYFINNKTASKKCQACLYFQNATCRGLMNDKFIDTKNRLIAKLGDDNYNAVKSDYENRTVVLGSACSKHCRFCFDRFVPPKILRVIPFLNPSEVHHFLHYLPKPIHYIGTSFHCRSGETTESPFFHDIMSLFFSLTDSFFVITNGHGINRKSVEIFKNKGIHISLTVITLNQTWHKKLVGGIPIIDYLSLTKVLRDNKIAYSVGLIPFKGLISSKDIFMTIDKFLENDPSCIIRIQRPSSSKYFSKKIRDEFKLNYTRFKQNVKNRYHLKNVAFMDDYIVDNIDYDGGNSYISPVQFENLLKIVKCKIEDLCRGKGKYLVLCPERTFEYLRDLNSKTIKVVKVTSLLGYTSPCAGVLRVEDYLAAFNKHAGSFDGLIIPRKTFDVNLDDFSMVGVNHLWAKVRSRVKSLFFLS